MSEEGLDQITKIGFEDQVGSFGEVHQGRKDECVKQKEVQQSALQKQSINCEQPKQQYFDESFPTLSEIQNSIRILSFVLPEMFTQRVTNSFYQRLFDKLIEVKKIKESSSLPKKEEKTNGQDCFSKEQTISAKKLESVSTRYNQSSPLKQSGVVCTTLQPNLTMRNMNNFNFQFEQKRLLRIEIVNSFCSGGGCEAVKRKIQHSKLNCQINQNTYDQLLSEMIIGTINLLEKQYNRGLRGNQSCFMLSRDSKHILVIVLNHKKYLDSVNCELIFKAMRQFAESEDINLRKSDRKKILDKIDQQIAELNESNSLIKYETDSRISASHKTVDTNYEGRFRVSREQAKFMKYDLHKVWNGHFERLMVDMYRAGFSFVQIRDRLCLNFPKQSQLFSIGALRSMLFKIMRMAIRRLQEQINKCDRPPKPILTRLKDQLVKNIINCAQTFQIRRLLIDLHMSEKYGPTKLSHLIEMINQYAKNGGDIKKKDVSKFINKNDF